MKYIVAALSAFCLILAFTADTPATADSKDCKTKNFKTKLVKEACEKGGQPAAKKAMKKWLREAKKKDAKLNCKSCHKSLKPNYENKKGAYKKFKELGGK